MAQHITKQPNGKYAIFCSVVDDFIAYDATAEECYEHFRKQAVEESDRRTARSLELANTSSSRFGDDVDRIRQIHGDKKAAEVLQLMQGTSR